MGAIVLAVAANQVAAQSDATDASTAKTADIPGLLGRTDLSFKAGVMEIRHEVVQPRGVVTGFESNLPITDGFDYHLNFTYDRAAKTQLTVQDMQLDNAVTYFYRTKVATPFLSAGLGYDWARTTTTGVRTRDNHLLYEGATGVEVAVAKSAAVRVGLDFDESFRKPHGRRIGYDVTTNYWFGDTVGASVGATVLSGRNNVHDEVLYLAGLHLSFD